MTAGDLAGDEHEPQIHKSTTERLIYMANQIAGFFGSQGTEQSAVAGVADHIKSFWDPSMRRGIFAHLDATGGEGLKPIALQAVQHLREAAPGVVRAEVEAAGMRSGREPGNDAG